MPGTILGDAVVLCLLYLAAKPSHMGVNVDGLVCPLHRPTAYNCQLRGQSFLSCAALSHHAAVGGGAFLRCVRHPVLDI
jgi:hypothetical protein